MANDEAISLRHHFADLPDPRGERSRRHELLDIIGIAICAVISGAESWTAVEAYGHAKHDWLKSLLALPNGIPSHDTFRRVFCLLDPEAFQQSFADWARRRDGAGAAAVVWRLCTWSPPGPVPTMSAWARWRSMKSRTRSRRSRDCWSCSTFPVRW
jgi:hypothetical protein